MITKPRIKRAPSMSGSTDIGFDQAQTKAEKGSDKAQSGRGLFCIRRMLRRYRVATTGR